MGRSMSSCTTRATKRTCSIALTTSLRNRTPSILTSAIRVHGFKRRYPYDARKRNGVVRARRARNMPYRANRFLRRLGAKRRASRCHRTNARKIGTINFAPAWTRLINSNTVLTVGAFVRQDQIQLLPKRQSLRRSHSRSSTSDRRPEPPADEYRRPRKPVVCERHKQR